MFRSRTTTGISTTLLLMTYGVFGWLYASWVIRMMGDDGIASQILEPQTRVAILYAIGIAWVLAIAIIFTAPVALKKISLSNWLKSDVRAFFLVFFGALFFALIVQCLDFFARFFILFANAILVKLDLQTLGLSRWLSYLVLAIMSVGSFVGGIIAFYYWG